jgi:hypothetical protein
MVRLFRVFDVLEDRADDDYAPINRPLLRHNRSPRAIALYERMIADPEMQPGDAVDSLPRGRLPESLAATVSATARELWELLLFRERR